MAEISGSDVPTLINAEDNLGREEYSQKDAKHAFRNRNTKSRRGPRVYKFLPPKESNEISVNRLGWHQIPKWQNLVFTMRLP